MHDPKAIEAMREAVHATRYTRVGMPVLPPTDADEVAYAEALATAALAALYTLHPGAAAIISGEAVAVPREATVKMLWAADRTLFDGNHLDPEAPDFVLFGQTAAEYRAMLAASPYAQETNDAE